MRTQPCDSLQISSLDDLIKSIRNGAIGKNLDKARVSVAFTTRQVSRHDSRNQLYRNEVLSLRVDNAVGSCATEPDQADIPIYDCIGAAVSELLDHPLGAVRIAALDAFLSSSYPHHQYANKVLIPSGSSLEKSVSRAASVASLVPDGCSNVLVVGVVNSLLQQLRIRGIPYIPCDFKGGITEWGEPVITELDSALGSCDAIMATGMTLGNGTFDLLLNCARRRQIPLIFFAQTASSILPWFLGQGVTAVSAEPYPFFWLDGNESTIYHYRLTESFGER